MNNARRGIQYLRCSVALLLVALVAGCGGGGQAPILGTGGGAALAPTITAVTPVNNSINLAIRNPIISATFSEPMALVAGKASFTVSCAAPCVNPTGVVALNAALQTATFTLTAGTALTPLTLYTATVTGATSVATGLPMDLPYSWHFTTGLAPTVTAVAPVNGATSVPSNNTIITASFSEPMAPITGAASFTVTCAAPCVSPAGTVSLNAANRVATYALPAGKTLTPLTLYTATVTGATSLATGLALDIPYVWHFTTALAADTTRPRVILTVPATTLPGPTLGAAANTSVSAIFSEDMAPATLNAGSFTLTCAAPCSAPAGVVNYVVGTRIVAFTPATVLANSTTYTATVSTAATDLAGNALAGNQAALPAASNYIWTFTTAAAVLPPANISMLSVYPLSGAVNVCPNAAINATFAVPSGLRLDPATVNTATFTVTGPAPGLLPVNAASVLLDVATGRIATFTPLADLTIGTTYTVTIKGGAAGIKDMAIPANTLLSDVTWKLTVGPATGVCLEPVVLGTADLFGILGGSAGTTNQGILTVINGDIGTTGVSTIVTGFHDSSPGCIYTETPLNVGTVNGTIYTSAPPPTVACPTEGTAVTAAVASKGRADALTAYNAMVALASGSDPGAGSLANLVLTPGVYTAVAGSFRLQGGNLTLDAQGNANAVWIFQMANSLTVGGPGAAFPQSVLLINGAQSKNVFWQVGSAATINAGGGGTMEGTIISQGGAAFSTANNVILATLNGRVLSLGASVTVVNTVINVPAP